MANATIWAQRVAEWRASGLTAAKYAESRGVGLSALRYWTQRVGRGPIPAAAAAVAAAAPAPSRANALVATRMARVVTGATADATVRLSDRGRASGVVLEIRGIRISVAAGFDRTTLAEVVDVLGAGGHA